MITLSQGQRQRSGRAQFARYHSVELDRDETGQFSGTEKRAVLPLVTDALQAARPFCGTLLYLRSRKEPRALAGPYSGGAGRRIH